MADEDLSALFDHARARQDLELTRRARGTTTERLATLRAARQQRAHRRHRRARWSAVAAAAAALSALWLGRARSDKRDPPPLSFAIGETSIPGEVGAWIAPSPSAGGVAVRFSEGSDVYVRSSAAIRVAELGDRGAVVVVERGSVYTHVAPREGNAWSIVAGPYRVHVKGTRFETRWEPTTGRLHVEMEEGRVLVVGPCLGAGRSLGAGDIGDLGCPEKAEIAVADPPTSAAQPATAPMATPMTSPRRIAAPGAPSSVDPMGRLAVDRVVATGTADELMALADAARAAGRRDVAERAYRAVLARFRGADAAARATFLLGRLLAEASRAGEAEALFAQYATNWPAGVFAQEAAARLLECALARRDDATAQTRARDYLARFPDGPAADVAARTLRGRRTGGR